jgi:hypothetical protein
MLLNGAEGGTDQVAVTTDNSGGDSGDAFNQVTTAAGAVNQFDVAAKTVGSLGYAIGNRGTAARTHVGWSSGVQSSRGVSFGWCDVTVSATPTTSTQLVAFYNGANEIVRLYWTTGNHLEFWDGVSFAFISSTISSTALTALTVYRVEFAIDAIRKTCEWRLYTVGTQTLLERRSGWFTSTQTAVDSTRFGVHNAANLPTATGFVYYDQLVADTDSWPLTSPSSPTPEVPARHFGPF